MTNEGKKAYLAGPMSNLPQYNFPLFDEVACQLRLDGWTIISPADMDREAGFDPLLGDSLADFSKEERQDFLDFAASRDIAAIRECKYLILLPGFLTSAGASAERLLGYWLHKEVLEYVPKAPTGEGIGQAYELREITRTHDILEEALQLTAGARNNQYGPPDQDFRRSIGMVNALFAHKLTTPFEPSDLARILLCIKLSRSIWQTKRDNYVDMAGYARCMWMCDGSPTE